MFNFVDFAVPVSQSPGMLLHLDLRSARIHSCWVEFLQGWEVSDVSCDIDANQAVVVFAFGAAVGNDRHGDGCWGCDSRSGWFYVDQPDQCC